jgi:hypothetical protein
MKTLRESFTTVLILESSVVPSRGGILHLALGVNAVIYLVYPLIRHL